LDPFVTYSALEEAEIIPGKHSNTRIKPLDLTNGHGHYIAVTPERALASVGGMPVKYIAVKFLGVSLPKPPCIHNGRSLLKPPLGGFRSEIVTWIQKWFKISVGTSRKFYI
jgi:hypothetical protein